MNNRTAVSSIISGHIDMILLAVISKADCYGYNISKTIAHITHGAVEIKEATLYSVLRRLEAQKLVQTYWGNETQGSRRKYYCLTPQGRGALDEQIERWQISCDVIAKILDRRNTDDE